MEVLNETTLSLLLRSDMELLGFSWVEEGRDVEIHLRLPGTDPRGERDCALICQWATGVTVKLGLAKDRGGRLLTWDATYVREPSGTWLIRLDFGADGELCLSCSEFGVRPSCREWRGP